MIAEILTNSFKESKKLNTIKPKEPAPDNQITNSVQNEKVTELEELIQICRSLREEGKTLQSLKKLREAKLSYPNESKLLWELHLTYEDVIAPKSEDELNNIMSLGKEVAKDHWEIAKKLTEQPAKGTSKNNRTLFLEQSLNQHQTFNPLRNRLVDIEIKSQLKTKPDAKDITLIMDFYDLVDDLKIQTTLSDQPEATWKTLRLTGVLATLKLYNGNIGCLYFLPMKRRPIILGIIMDLLPVCTTKILFKTFMQAREHF